LPADAFLIMLATAYLSPVVARRDCSLLVAWLAQHWYQCKTVQACTLDHVIQPHAYPQTTAGTAVPEYIEGALFDLQVRIIDKHLEGGRLYLKKGTVVDVHPGATCDVTVDDTRLVVQVGG
jgi:hypothetical protein